MTFKEKIIVLALSVILIGMVIPSFIQYGNIKEKDDVYRGKVVVIEGCEYIVVMGDVVHKGNCTNIIHNCANIINKGEQ